MLNPVRSTLASQPGKRSLTHNGLLLASSIILQLLLALFFGHAYDTRIFMATGYLVGTGQNPFIAQNLSAVFQNITFQGITSFGYPPPWAMVLGVIYLFTYKIIPNFLLYNLAIKLPVIAANICLAYWVAHLLRKLGAGEILSRRGWVIMLFNPFLLCTSSAWGQFDTVVALLSLLALELLDQGKVTSPAVLLALAVACKPIALPLIPVVFVYLVKRSMRHTLQYFAVFSGSMFLFCVVPFFLFGWNPAPILEHWNFHFTMGGGLSFMTFLEALKQTTLLTGTERILGWLWVPALGIATYFMRRGITGFMDLLKKSAVMILVFDLCRTWLSEPNIILVLTPVLILTLVHELPPLSMAAIWGLPLIFGLFNTSLAQLFFPGMPGIMETLLKIAAEFGPARLALRSGAVIAWLAAGWWIVFILIKKPLQSNTTKGLL
jgi:hypothetical protein